MPAYTGTASNDTLAGSAGADTLTGLAGNDTYLVNSLADLVVEASGGGVDTVRIALAALRVYSIENWAYVENLAWTGTTGAQLKGNGAANLITANSSATELDADTLYGAAGNDTLRGYYGNDSLVGGTGDDSLDGGAGIDRMVGGAGNDRYVIDSTSDRAYEYASGGFDTVVSAVAKDLRLSWAQYVEGLLYTGTAAAALHGNAQSNRIDSASAGNDTLNGYDGDDTLDGGGGNDLLLGGLGDDTYLVSATDLVTEAADAGTDTFVGAKTSINVGSWATTVENLFYTGTAAVAVTGNGLANLISGGAGNNTVSAGDGHDTVLGGAGADSLLGGNGDDVLYGASNPDTRWIADRKLTPDTGTDTLAGGLGNDRYLIDRTNDLVVESAGAGTLDVLISAIDNSLLRYGANAIEALVLQRNSAAWFGEGSTRGDVIVGNEGDNYLVGGLGNDTLSARADHGVFGAQSDVLDGGDGNDVLLAVDFNAFSTAAHEITFFGGAGNDLYVIDAAVDSVGGQDTVGTDTAILLSSNSVALLEGVDKIVLYGADATLDAQARAAVQLAYAAANGAAAVYTGGWGTAYDATGNDVANTIVGNAQDNRLVGGAGNDTVSGGLGNDTLEGGTGTDSLVGGAGNDWFYLDTGDAAVEAAGGGFDVLASQTLSTNAAFGAYANFEGWQYLGAANVVLNRGSSNTSSDLLIGGQGNDTLAGFGGNDTLGGAAGLDSITGGAGEDSVFGDAGNDALDGGTENDTLDGGDGNDTLLGQLGDDRLLGGAGDDQIDAGGNWDHVDGGAGDDVAAGGDGRDTLLGGAGADVLYGQGNEDVIVGGAGSDEIAGGGALPADGPTTSSHGDHLWGDQQYQTGGGEADAFVFDTVLAANGVSETFNGSGVYEFIAGATIGDFEVGLDLIGVTKDFGDVGSPIPLGDGDDLLENAATTTSSGQGFSAAAEIVFVRADVADTFAYSRSSFFDDIDANAVGLVIGDASAALAVNSTKLFVVDDGSHSAVFLFQSANGDAAITPDELYLLTVVTGTASLSVSDFALF